MRVGHGRPLAACLLVLLEATLRTLAEDYGPEAVQLLWQHERKQRRGGVLGFPRDADIHGGVPMGIKQDDCDNGKDSIEVDWNPESTSEWACDGPTLHPTQADPTYTFEKKEKPPLHKCYPEEINYGTPVPMSGPHRPLWPRYGEYKYLPPQRWVHSLEHGAAVFLYHPCADPEEIRQFKDIGVSCLYKHIITPNKGLSVDQPFAIVTWMYNMNMSHVDREAAMRFVKMTALRAPERAVDEDGQYDVALQQASPPLSDYGDVICPVSEDVESLARAVRQKAGLLARMFRSYVQHNNQVP